MLAERFRWASKHKCNAWTLSDFNGTRLLHVIGNTCYFATNDCCEELTPLFCVSVLLSHLQTQIQLFIAAHLIVLGHKLTSKVCSEHQSWPRSKLHPISVQSSYMLETRMYLHGCSSFWNKTTAQSRGAAWGSTRSTLLHRSSYLCERSGHIGCIQEVQILLIIQRNHDNWSNISINEI